MKLEEIWVLVRSADKRFGPSVIVGEEEFHRMLFAETQKFYPCLDTDFKSEIRGYVSFSKLINDGTLTLSEVADSVVAWAGYAEDDCEYEQDMETVGLVKANLLNPQLLHESKVFVQERPLVDDLPELLVGNRPSSEQAMSGYSVATRYGVYEGRAFDLVDAMFHAFRFPSEGTPVTERKPAAQRDPEPWLL